MILKDLPFNEYRKMDGINASSLKAMDLSPRHFYNAYYNGREDTSSLSFGRLAHAFILENDKFHSLYKLLPEGKNRTHKEAKDMIAAGFEVLSQKEYEKLQQMQAVLLAHPVASRLLALPGDAEITFTWDSNDLVCKARLDKLTHNNVIIDYKTSQSVQPRDFTRSVFGYGYHIQMAHYMVAVAANTNMAVEDVDFCFIVQESEAPYDCVVYEPDKELIEYAMQRRAVLLNRVAWCLGAGEWSGLSDSVEPIYLPKWMKGENGNE